MAALSAHGEIAPETSSLMRPDWRKIGLIRVLNMPVGGEIGAEAGQVSRDY